MKNLRMIYCMAMLAGAVFLLTTTAQAELLAYFPFDGNTNEVVNDLPVTVNGGGLSFSTGVFGQAASFDGVDDYLDVTDGPDDVLEALDDAAPDVWGTMMCWVKTTDVSTSNTYGGPTFVERRDPTNEFKMLYHLGLSTEGYFLNFSKPPMKGLIASVQYGSGPVAPKINDGQWHHIATTVKRSGDETTSYIYVFVDGYQHGVFELGSDAASDFTTCENLRIGARAKNYGVPDCYADAEIDELAIYDEWMGGPAIREIMVNGVIPEPGTLTLLVLGLFVGLFVRKR